MEKTQQSRVVRGESRQQFGALRSERSELRRTVRGKLKTIIKKKKVKKSFPSDETWYIGKR